MAATLTVRELLTKWSFKTDDKPIANFDKIIGGMKKSVLAVGAALSSAAVGLGVMIYKSAKTTDEMGKMSDRLGVNFKDLQALKFIAGQTGATFEDVSNGLRFLSRTSSLAAQGNKTYLKTFKELGMGLDDLKTKSPVDLLLSVADGFKYIKNPADQTRIAMELFSRGGSAMVPMLNEGKRGIVELAKKAETLGGILGTDAKTTSAVFLDTLEQLEFAIQGIVASLGSKLMPTVLTYIKVLVAWIENNGELIKQNIDKMATSLGNAIKNLMPFLMKILMSLPSVIEKMVVFFEYLTEIMPYFKMVIGPIIALIDYLGTMMGERFARLYVIFDSIYTFGQKLVKLFPGIIQTIKKLVEMLTWISDALGDLSNSIWTAITSGFSNAFDWVIKKAAATIDWLKSKLGGAWDWIVGKGGEKNIVITTQQAQRTAAALGGSKLQGAISPGTSPVTGRQGQQINIQNITNVTTPPGTSTSEAERIADTTSAATTRTFRQAMGDIS